MTMTRAVYLLENGRGRRIKEVGAGPGRAPASGARSRAPRRRFRAAARRIRR